MCGFRFTKCTKHVQIDETLSFGILAPSKFQVFCSLGTQVPKTLLWPNYTSKATTLENNKAFKT